MVPWRFAQAVDAEGEADDVGVVTLTTGSAEQFLVAANTSESMHRRTNSRTWRGGRANRPRRRWRAGQPGRGIQPGQERTHVREPRREPLSRG
jgi:hypothetical protein